MGNREEYLRGTNDKGGSQSCAATGLRVVTAFIAAVSENRSQGIPVAVWLFAAYRPTFAVVLV